MNSRSRARYLFPCVQVKSHLAAAAGPSCDQLRVSWSLATFQPEAAPSVVHCPDIRDSEVGSYTVTLSAANRLIGEVA